MAEQAALPLELRHAGVWVPRNRIGPVGWIGPEPRPVSPSEAWSPHADRDIVLVPYNGSPVAQAALPVAAPCALQLRATVLVLYVRPWDVCRGGFFFIETREEAREIAERGARCLRAAGVSADAVVADADRRLLSAAIVAYARTVQAQAIVMGTGARGALHAIFVGSTSGHVARRCERRVILVRPDRTGAVRWSRARPIGGSP
ncbi:universal stress protein [Nocardioides guangzhouensis]|uniref:Universal stress protein n=1 Tax=Nocardioides guangzhouensis TaxID=2497878 RepID=A0A4Q4Z5L7_9ACTN|nr:universal stress protein [Nocardioides guangzhouensis]RYP82972.1 universal stress protein [Nocardioides guangzhouensis]